MTDREATSFFRHKPQKEKRCTQCVLLFSFSIFIGGCATTIPNGGSETREVHTSAGVPVKITRIGVSDVPVHYDVQVAAGSVWATAPGIFSQHTIKIDPKTNRVTELPRPFTAAGANLLVDEHAMWLSDNVTPIAGRGDLRRIDLNSNQTIAIIEAVGAPFATGDDAVWAYNHLTGVVTGINIQDNRVRTKIATKGRLYLETITFGAGSLWQFTFEGNVSNMQLNPCLYSMLAKCVVPSGMVRRIDTRSGKVIAEIPVGPFAPTDRIKYVAGSIWLLGYRDENGAAYATRIDVATNRVAATIPLPKLNACVMHTGPKTPIEWKGAIWLSTFCTAKGKAEGRLLKIDLQKNEVVDQLILSSRDGHEGLEPLLAAGEGAVWGFDGSSALRFDF